MNLIFNSNCLFSNSMSASFCTVSSFSGNDIVKHFCVTVSYQRITSLAAFLAVSKRLKISP